MPTALAPVIGAFVVGSNDTMPQHRWSDASSSTLAWSTLAVSMLASGTASAQPGPEAPYSAVVRGGAATASTGTATAIALLDVETTHADLGAGWDGAMGFQVGRRPMLTMTKASHDAPVEPADAGGFIMAESMRFARTTGSVETALVGRMGATRADADPTAVHNDISGWALLFDACLDVRWYDREVGVARTTIGPLAPRLQLWLGVRHDQRFHRAGDLGGFDDPTGRIIAGVAVNPIRIREARFAAGAALELEGALRGPARLPSAVRLVVSGTLDLRRAASWGHEADGR